jgi:hypothetical protein
MKGETEGEMTSERRGEVKYGRRRCQKKEDKSSHKKEI